ncbi:MAG: hypothetical protein HYV96_09895 [Opitutae bacterium]|nr:hypothetical protein [Opitutae bacterium]
MTLIVCLSPDTHPVLFSDTLLSSESGRPAVALPSVGQRHDGIESARKLKIWGCEQKVVQICTRIVAVWAGDYARARAVLTAVEEVFGAGPVNASFLRTYLRANHDEALPHVALIFSVLEEVGSTETVWFGCRATVVPPVGQIVFAGSGSDRFSRYANQIPMRILRAGDYVRIGVAAALQFTGCLLADEMATGAPLQDSFGGAYEIATFWGGCSQKISDCVYLFWFPEQDAAGGIAFSLQPRKFIRRYENNGHTAFYCIEAEPTAGFGAKITKEELFVMPNFLRRETAVDVSQRRPSLNTTWQVNVFCVKLRDGSHRIASQINYRHEARGHPVQFRDVDDLQFEMSIDLESVRQTLVGLVRR